MGLLSFIKSIFTKADAIEIVVDSVIEEVAKVEPKAAAKVKAEVAKVKKVKAEAKEVVAKVEAKVSKPKAKKVTK